jgi:hypothetical protein
MPILDRKGSRRSKRIEKPTHEQTRNEESSRNWNVFMLVPNIQRLNIILQILEAESVWAFVWSRPRQTENYYILDGYIIFEIPCTPH